MKFLEKVCEKLKLNEKKEVQIKISLENDKQLDRRGERSLGLLLIG